MKKLSLFFILFFQSVVAQNTFIRITDSNFGAYNKVMPASGSGWALFSGDNLRLSKYNSCGFHEWSKTYFTSQTLYGLYDFIQLRNGDFAFMNRITKNGLEITALSRLDSSGNVIWSKSFGDNDYNHFPYTLLEDNTGDLYIYGNVEHTGGSPNYNMLMKFDANGNPAWTKFYDHGGIWGGAIITSDNGVLMRTGNMMIKTDLNGNVQWTTTLNIATYYHLAPLEVSDGYIFTGYTTPGTFVTFYKIDKQGNLLWGEGKRTDLEGIPPRMKVTPNGNITGTFRKIISSDIYTFIVEFDADLNVVKTNALNNGAYLTGIDLCFLSDGSTVISGAENAGYCFFAHGDASYKTGCDLQLPSPVITSVPASTSFISTNAINYTFNSYTESIPADTFSVNVTTYCIPQKFLELGDDTTFCEGITYTIQNQTIDTFNIYQWSTGETSREITVTQSGTYYLTVSDLCGEASLLDSITITVLDNVEINAGSDLSICEDASVLLQATGCDSCTYYWNNGSNTDTTTINESGIYIVNALNNNGCSGSDTIEVIQSKCECNLYIPNAFSPNNDLINEAIGVHYYCDLLSFEFRIFNRWGQLLFSTDNPDSLWKGKYNDKDVMEGLYIYSLKYKPLIRGKKEETITRTGTITLLR